LNKIHLLSKTNQAESVSFSFLQRIRIMKKIISALALASLSASAFAAGPANNQNPYYVGISVGQAKTDTGIENLRGNISLDESDTGYKIFGGVKLNPIFSAEVQYANLGTASLRGNTGSQFTVEGDTFQFTSNGQIDVETQSFGVAAVAGFDLNSAIRPYAKLGVHYWDAKFSGSAGGTASENGTDLFYGAGVEFSINKNLAARVEAENYNLDGSDARLISVGVSYKF
jgi:OmpA-OmpF porin, OOP family